MFFTRLIAILTLAGCAHTTVHAMEAKGPGGRKNNRNSSSGDQALSTTRNNQHQNTCDYPNCRSSFATTELLAKHRRMHTGEIRYLCTLCNTSFVRTRDLTEHQESSGH